MKIAVFIFSLLFCGTICATEPYIVKQRVVQFDPNTYLGVQGYYTHGENLRVQKSTEESETLKELREQNKILRDLVNAVLAGRKLPESPVEEPVQPSGNPLEQAVLKIFVEKCAKCHGDTKQDGGLTLVKEGKLFDITSEEAFSVFDRSNGVDLEADEARMPKGAPALSDEEVKVLYKWAKSKTKK